MAECEQCGKDYEAKRADSRFCPGGACKQAAHRLSVTNASRNTGEPVTDKSGFPPLGADGWPTYTQLSGRVVYGQPAVRYQGDRFESRPMPIHPDDTPDARNRCIFMDDWGEYIIDAVGKAFRRSGDWPAAARVEMDKRQRDCCSPRQMGPSVHA